MKKLTIITVLIITLLLTGCNNGGPISNVSYKNFAKKVENKDTFILEVVQTGCSNCAEFTPKFEEVLEEKGLEAYSINISDMSDEDYEKFNEDYAVDGTPTVIFFTKGKESSVLKRINGNRDKDYIIQKLESNGFIK